MAQYQNWSETLIPFGILNKAEEQLSIYFCKSSETSDFIVDCLSQWWENNHNNYLELEELVIREEQKNKIPAFMVNIDAPNSYLCGFKAGILFPGRTLI